MTDMPYHAASDARGGNPVDQALAAVAEYQRHQRQNTRLMLGLAAIDTGLHQVEAGKTADGIVSIRHGLDFLRPMIGGQQ